MSSSAFRTRALALALASALCTHAPLHAAGTDAAARLPTRVAPEAAAWLDAIGVAAARVQDYGGFLWVELSDAERAALQAHGVELELQPEAHQVQVGRYRFDPIRDGQSVPKSRSDDGRGFRLVQFSGPTRQDWLDALRASGLEPLQYYPHNAYLVWSTGNARSALANHAFVRWHDAFHEDYRLADDLRQRSGRIDNVSVVFFNDGDIEGTLAALRGLGARILDHHPAQPDRRLFNAIVQIDAAALSDVAKLATVLWAGYSHPEPVHDDEMSDQIQAGNHPGGTPVTGYSAYLAGLGYDGDGVRWAVVDSGIDYDHPDLGPSIVAGFNFPGACTVAGQPGTDCEGGGHGTHVAGIVGGSGAAGFTDAGGFLYGLGVAPGVDLVAMNSLSASAWPPAGGWQEHSKRALALGSVGTSNSWTTGEGTAHGYQASERTHDQMSHDGDFDTPANIEPIITVFSAGNSGEQGARTLTAPKEAKNVIVVASSVNARVGSIENISGFSSRGPAVDGRIVPTIAAPGEQIASTRNDLGGNCSTPIAGTSNRYAFCSGTSMAAPHVSGALAIATEWWRGFNAGADPSPAMAKALLVNSAVDMGTANRPNSAEGWGRVNLERMIDPAANVEYFDQTHLFGAAGESFELTVQPANPALPVQITMAWNDAVGAIGANPALVNDLDLTVSDGPTSYRGNVFANGWSATGGTRDALNNLENVYLQSPSGQAIVIRIDAINIAGDGAWGNADATDQSFALICSNCLQQPGYTLAVEPDEFAVCAPDDVQSSVSIGSVLGYTDAVTLALADVPAGVDASLGTSVLTPPQTTTLNLDDISSAAVGDHVLRVLASSNSGAKEATVALSVFDAAASAPGLLAPEDNAIGVGATPTFTWSASPQAQTYLLEVSRTADFSDLLLSQAVDGTSFTPGSPLPTSTNLWWRVRADNVCSTGLPSPGRRFQTVLAPGDCNPDSQIVASHFSDDIESGANGWTSSGTGNTWVQSTSLPRSPVTSWSATGPAISSDQRLVTPPIAVPPLGARSPVLVFHHSRSLEVRSSGGCWDGGVLESSTNGGTNWTAVPAAQILTDPYTGNLGGGPGNGLPAWCGVATEYRRVVVNATPWMGQNVAFRFRLSSDGSVASESWRIDDVELRSCASASSQVSLDATTVGQGSVSASPDLSTYAVNSEVTLTATPEAGWRFVGWSGDVISTANPLELLMADDTDVTATFVAKQASQAAFAPFNEVVRVGQAASFSVRVTGASSAPSNGNVVVSASSGESCSSSTPVTVAGPTGTVFSCPLTFATLGPRTIAATFDENGTHLGSNSPSAPVNALRFADVSVTAGDGSGAATPGGAANYLVEVRNAGPDAAVDVPLQISIAPELLAQSWDCVVAQGAATCPQASGSGSVETTVTLPANSRLDYLLGGTYANDLDSVTVLSAEVAPVAAAPAYTHDPSTGNNTATDVNLLPEVFGDGFEP
jgi:hypothetical protein